MSPRSIVSSPASGELTAFLRFFVPATRNETGYTGDLICDDCGKALEIVTVTPMLKHVYETVNAVKAICTAKGYTGDIYCKDFGKRYLAAKPLPKIPVTIPKLSR